MVADSGSARLVQLSNIINIETQPFDPATFKEVEEEVYVDELGHQRVRLPDQNVIRWRRKLNEDGTTIVESNARYVYPMDISVGNTPSVLMQMWHKADRELSFMNVTTLASDSVSSVLQCLCVTPKGFVPAKKMQMGGLLLNVNGQHIFWWNERTSFHCRFVRWSDGSLQLLIGDEVLDVAEVDIEKDNNYLFLRHVQAQVLEASLSVCLHFTCVHGY